MAVDLLGSTIRVDGDNGGTDVVVSQTDISFDASDDSINDASSGFGAGLADGDRILVKGATNLENRGQFIVESATTSKIIVKETGRIVTESAGASVTVRERGPGYSLKDIDTAVANATYMDVLAFPGETNSGVTIAAGGITKAFIMNALLLIRNDSLLRDQGCIWLHTVNDGSNPAIEFENEYATIDMGHLNDDDPDQPVTVFGSTTAANIRFGATYSFMSSVDDQEWCAGGGGIFQWHGGMMRFRDDTNTGNTVEGENESYSTTFPDETSLIQVNTENFGGAVFGGIKYRLQEITLKSSKYDGIDFQGTTVRRCKDIITMDSDIGLQLTGSGSPVVTGFRLRGHTADLQVNGLTGDPILFNSDTIGTLHATMTFGTGGSLLEANTYDVSIVDNSGDGIDDVRGAVYRKSDGVLYGSEEVSAGGATDVPAVFPQFTARRNLYDSTNDGPPLAYGNFGIRLRNFRKSFMDIEKVPAEAALEDTFIMLDDPYMTVTNEVTVSAYTGFAIDENDQEIDITSAHTMAELYDWLKYAQYQANAMDVEQLMKTKDGVSYTMPAAWDINGIDNLDLSGKYIINRYVPVQIDGIVSGTRCAVVNKATNTTLSSGTATGTSITLTTPYTAATNVFIRARLASYDNFSSLILLGSTGNSVNAQLGLDPEYTP